MSYGYDRFGTLCPHCGVKLVPPFAWVTPDGRVICKAKRQEQRLAWLRRNHPERIGVPR